MARLGTRIFSRQAATNAEYEKNSKHEIRNSKQVQMTNGRNFKTSGASDVLDLDLDI